MKLTLFPEHIIFEVVFACTKKSMFLTVNITEKDHGLNDLKTRLLNARRARLTYHTYGDDYNVTGHIPRYYHMY